MYFDLFPAVEASATVLTRSERLSRLLRTAYTQQQRDKNRTVWKTPRILPWDAWLRKQIEYEPHLLNPAQESALWESVIAESPQGRSLLRIPKAARAAAQAWKLLHDYRLPFEHGLFFVTDDCEAFFDWASEFQSHCDRNGWLDSARLTAYITDHTPRQAQFILAGFDDVTPAEQHLIAKLTEATHWRVPEFESAPVRAAFRDTANEIQNAALWARDKLEQNASAQIGILVPGIERVGSKLDRIFEEILPGAFHISLGPALIEWPLVHAALLWIELVTGPLEIERASILLRSPYRKGGAPERSQRVLTDAELRRGPNQPVSLHLLRPQVEPPPGEQSPSAWSRMFSSLLKAAGWPGNLQSSEYQAMDAWNRLLSQFSTLDCVVPSLSIQQAHAQLRTMTENTPFQPEDEGAPVQIMGLLEATGLRFDHLWVMGLHDEEFPPSAAPNPFLPVALQRAHNLPHASPEREREFSQNIFRRLCVSAPDVVFSYPEWEGDQQRTPSPLIASLPKVEMIRSTVLWPDLIRASASIELLDDHLAPALPAGCEQHGGTRVLKDMAACPFRAYATHRLAARALESPELGVNARDKGTAVHSALQYIWEQLQCQEALRNMSAPELQQLIADSIEQSLQDISGLGRELERRRLLALLTEWMEIERARPPFRPIGRELKHPLTIGGLQINTRIDRLDELSDGRLLILDYKTGEIKGEPWASERPDEPQVPLYAIAAEGPIAAAAFAQIRTGECCFRGISGNGQLAPLKPMKLAKTTTLPDLIEEWRTILNDLAENFRSGLAEVDPKHHSTCQYCDITPLCRVLDGDHD